MTDKLSRPKLARIPRPMTEKQKAARLANLAAGRKKRLEEIKQNKDKGEDYDDYDPSSDSDSSDSDAFVIKKKKKQPPKRELIREKDLPYAQKSEIEELRDMVYQLADITKKQAKKQKAARKKVPRPQKEGGTNVVVFPQNPPNQAGITNQVKPVSTTQMDQLWKSLYS